MLVEDYTDMIEFRFKYENEIRKLVRQARKPGKVRSDLRNKLVSDPTGDQATMDLTPIKRVTLIVGSKYHEKKIVIDEPEAWLQVISDTYGLYENTYIYEPLCLYFRKGKSSDTASALCGVSRQTLYWRKKEFLVDAAILASKKKLIDF